MEKVAFRSAAKRGPRKIFGIAIGPFTLALILLAVVVLVMWRPWGETNAVVHVKEVEPPTPSPFTYKEYRDWDLEGHDKAVALVELESDDVLISADVRAGQLVVVDRKNRRGLQYDLGSGEIIRDIDLNKIDIVFVIDTSASMYPYLESFKKAVSQYVSRYEGMDRPRFGLVLAEPGEDFQVVPLQDAAGIISLIVALQTGAEGEDTAFTALWAVVTGQLDDRLGFRERSQRIVTVLSDEPASRGEDGRPMMPTQWRKDRVCGEIRYGVGLGIELMVFTFGTHEVRQTWGSFGSWGPCAVKVININDVDHHDSWLLHLQRVWSDQSGRDAR